MRYLRVKDVAKHYGRSVRRVRQWCEQGRFKGAYKHGRDWLIPDTSLKGFTLNPAGRPPQRKEQNHGKEPTADAVRARSQCGDG